MLFCFNSENNPRVGIFATFFIDKNGVFAEKKSGLVRNKYRCGLTENCKKRLSKEQFQEEHEK